MPLQNLANRLVAKEPTQCKSAHGDEEAMVAEEYANGQVDALSVELTLIIQRMDKLIMLRLTIPPGSSFKPYDYSTLINDTNNVGAGSLLYDVRQPLPGYPCTTGNLTPLQGGNCLEDYDFKFPGRRRATLCLCWI